MLFPVVFLLVFVGSITNDSVLNLPNHVYLLDVYAVNYVYVNKPMMYNDANNYCKSLLNAELVTIESATMNGDLYGEIMKLQRNNSTQYWIGLQYSNAFEDGTSVSYVNFDKMPDNKDECNVYNYGKCVEVSLDGVWNYVDCNEERNFVCNVNRRGCLHNNQTTNIYGYNNAVCLSGYVISQLDGTYLYNGMYKGYPVYKKYKSLGFSDGNNQDEFVYFRHDNGEWILIRDICDENVDLYYMKCNNNSTSLLDCNANWNIFPFLNVNNTSINIVDGKCSNDDDLMLQVSQHLCLDDTKNYMNGIYQYTGMYNSRPLYVKHHNDSKLYIRWNNSYWFIDVHNDTSGMIVCKHYNLNECSDQWISISKPLTPILHYNTNPNDCTHHTSNPKDHKKVSIHPSFIFGIVLLVVVIIGLLLLTWCVYDYIPRKTGNAQEMAENMEDRPMIKSEINAPEYRHDPNEQNQRTNLVNDSLTDNSINTTISSNYASLRKIPPLKTILQQETLMPSNTNSIDIISNPLETISKSQLNGIDEYVYESKSIEQSQKLRYQYTFITNFLFFLSILTYDILIYSLLNVSLTSTIQDNKLELLNKITLEISRTYDESPEIANKFNKYILNNPDNFEDPLQGTLDDVRDNDFEDTNLYNVYDNKTEGINVYNILKKYTDVTNHSDNNSDNVNNISSKPLSMMLFMCFCIVYNILIFIGRLSKWEDIIEETTKEAIMNACQTNCNANYKTCPSMQRLYYIIVSFQLWECKNRKNTEQKTSIHDFLNNELDKYGNEYMYSDYHHYYEYHLDDEIFTKGLVKHLDDLFSFYDIDCCGKHAKACYSYYRLKKGTNNYQNICSNVDECVTMLMCDEVHWNVFCKHRVHMKQLVSDNVDIVEYIEVNEGHGTIPAYNLNNAPRPMHINIDIDEKKMDPDEKRDETAFNINEKHKEFLSGKRFNYWGIKDETVGISIVPSYQSFKQEMLSNTVYPISANMWEIDYKTSLAKYKVHGMVERDWNADYLLSGYQKIKSPYTTMQWEHVMAIILYTSHDQLASKFSKTIYGNDYKHSEFYYFGKYLTEAVLFFGKLTKRDDIYYHGLDNQFLFNCSTQLFCAPTSMSSKIKTAAVFARNGIILSIKSYRNEVKYFEPKSLSKFEEHEKIFIQESYEMRIVNITDKKSQIQMGYILNDEDFEYHREMKIIYLLQMLVEGNIYDINHDEDEHQDELPLPLINIQSNAQQMPIVSEESHPNIVVATPIIKDEQSETSNKREPSPLQSPLSPVDSKQDYKTDETNNTKCKPDLIALPSFGIKRDDEHTLSSFTHERHGRQSNRQSLSASKGASDKNLPEYILIKDSVSNNTFTVKLFQNSIIDLYQHIKATAMNFSNIRNLKESKKNPNDMFIYDLVKKASLTDNERDTHLECIHQMINEDFDTAKQVLKELRQYQPWKRIYLYTLFQKFVKSGVELVLPTKIFTITRWGNELNDNYFELLELLADILHVQIECERVYRVHINIIKKLFKNIKYLTIKDSFKGDTIVLNRQNVQGCDIFKILKPYIQKALKHSSFYTLPSLSPSHNINE